MARRTTALMAAVMFSILMAQPAAAGDVEPTIVGGTPAVPGEFPFVASIGGLKVGSHFCGGSLIDKDWVLSAAHCFDDVSANQITVTIGRTNLFGTDGEPGRCQRSEFIPSTIRSHSNMTWRWSSSNGRPPSPYPACLRLQP